MRFTSSFSIAALLVLSAATATAQQRPLLTEDPVTVGGGQILVEAGVDVTRDQFLTGSGLTGDMVRVPLGVSIGLSSIAELQIDGGPYQRLRITGREPAPLDFKLRVDGDTTSDIDDLVIGTKLRLAPESQQRPAFAIRLATKLPNAGNESGLGLDTLDFFATLLVAKTVRSVRYVGNAGIAVMGDPTRGDRQSDMLTFGFSIARAVVQGFEVVGEITGRYQWAEEFPPPGGENRASFRAGARYTRGAGRVDAALIVGATERDPGIGFTVGYTHVINAFSIP